MASQLALDRALHIDMLMAVPAARSSAAPLRRAILDDTDDEEKDHYPQRAAAAAAAPVRSRHIVVQRPSPTSSDSSDSSDDDPMEVAPPRRASASIPTTNPLEVDHDLAVDPHAPGKCPACHNFIFEAVGWSCGHTVCKKCAAQMKAVGCGRKCPSCRVADKVDPTAQASTDLLIQNITVQCPRECGATYSLGPKFRNVTQHEQVCPAVGIQCDQCSFTVQRSSLATHKTTTCSQRKQGCLLCGVDVLASEFDAHTKGVEQGGQCKGFQPCPNGCCDLDSEEDSRKRRRLLQAAVDEKWGEVQIADVKTKIIKACELEEHLKVCRLGQITCEVCGDKVARQQEKAHYSKEAMRHTKLLMQRLAAAPTAASPKVLVQQVTFAVDKLAPRGGNIAQSYVHTIVDPSRKLTVKISTVGVHDRAPGAGTLKLDLSIGKNHPDDPVWEFAAVYDVYMELMEQDAAGRWVLPKNEARTMKSTWPISSTVTSATFKAFPLSFFEIDNPLLLDRHQQFALLVRIFKH